MNAAKPPFGHGEIGPELWALAQSILDRLDPALRSAAALAAARLADEPGRCQQVWCPVCALAALVAGEQHPLLNVIGEHSMALLTLVRAVVNSHAGTPESAPPEPPDPRSPGGDGASPQTPSRYQNIPITIEE